MFQTTNQLTISAVEMAIDIIFSREIDPDLRFSQHDSEAEWKWGSNQMPRWPLCWECRLVILQPKTPAKNPRSLCPRIIQNLSAPLNLEPPVSETWRTTGIADIGIVDIAVHKSKPGWVANLA